MFEAPVIFVNMREFAVLYADDFDLAPILSPVRSNFWRFIWFWTFVLYFLCRLPPGLLYLWAVCFWRQQLALLPSSSYAVFHVLGIGFGFINWGWLLLLFSWCVDDMTHLKNMQQCQPSDSSAEELRPAI